MEKKFKIIAFILLGLFNSISAQKCNSDNYCYGYGDPHYILFNKKMVSLQQNCKVVLLSDSPSYNKTFLITAIPSKNPTSGAISIDSILIRFDATTYLIYETGLKVNENVVNLPFSDSNLGVENKSGTISIDNSLFYLTFGNAFLKLVACGSQTFGLCASIEDDPSSAFSKYLPNDLIWDNGMCVDSPKSVLSTTTSSTTPASAYFNLYKTLSGHVKQIKDLIVFRNSYLASCSDDTKIKIWNTNMIHLAPKTLSGHTSPVISLAILQNGYLASCSSTKIIIWDVDLEKNIKTINRVSQDFLQLAALMNGLLACSVTGGDIMIFDTNTGVSVSKLEAISSVNQLIVLKNGFLAVAYYDEKIIIWSIDSSNKGSKIKTMNVGYYIRSLIQLQNGYLASGGNTGQIKIWNPDTGALVKSLSVAGNTASIATLAVLKNGFLVSGNYDNSMRVWNTDNSSLISEIKQKSTPVVLTVLNNGDLVSAHAWDGIDENLSINFWH